MQSFYSAGKKGNWLMRDGKQEIEKIECIPSNISIFSSCGYYNIFYSENGNWYGGGDNSFSQQGEGPEEIRPFTKLSSFSGYIPQSISCGEKISAFLTTDGQLYVTGSEYKILTKIENLPPLSIISCGSNKILAIPKKQKGLFVIFSPSNVKFYEKDKNFIDCSAGRDFFLALDDSGIAYSWGKNIAVGCGDIQATKPIQLKTIKPSIQKVFSCYDQSILVAEDHSLFVAGNNHFNQLGIQSKDDFFSFFQIPIDFTKKKIDRIVFSEKVTYVLDSSGSVFCSSGSATSYLSQMIDDDDVDFRSKISTFKKMKFQNNLIVTNLAAGSDHVIFAANLGTFGNNRFVLYPKDLNHVPVYKDVMCKNENETSKVDVSDAAFAFLGYERENAVVEGKKIELAKIVGIIDKNTAVLEQIKTGLFIKISFQHPLVLHRNLRIITNSEKINEIEKKMKNESQQNKEKEKQEAKDKLNMSEIQEIENESQQNNEKEKQETKDKLNMNEIQEIENESQQNNEKQETKNKLSMNEIQDTEVKFTDICKSHHDAELHFTGEPVSFITRRTRSGLDLLFNVSDDACRVFGFLSGERVKHELIGDGSVVGAFGCNLWFAWDNDGGLVTNCNMNQVEMHNIIELTSPKNRQIDTFYLEDKKSVVTIETHLCKVLKKFGLKVNDFVTCRGRIGQIFGEFCYMAAIQYTDVNNSCETVLPSMVKLVRREVLKSDSSECQIVKVKSFNGKVVDVDVGYDEKIDHFIPLDRILTEKGFATVIGKEIGHVDQKGYWIQTDDALVLDLGVVLMKDLSKVKLLRRFSEKETRENGLIVSISPFDRDPLIYSGDVVRKNNKISLILGFDDQMNPVLYDLYDDMLYEIDQKNDEKKEFDVIYRAGIDSSFSLIFQHRVEINAKNNLEQFEGIGFKPGDLIAYPKGEAIVIGIDQDNIFIKNQERDFPAIIKAKDAYNRNLFYAVKRLGVGINL